MPGLSLVVCIIVNDIERRENFSRYHFFTASANQVRPRAIASNLCCPYTVAYMCANTKAM